LRRGGTSHIFAVKAGQRAQAPRWVAGSGSGVRRWARLPTREELTASRPLRPFAEHLSSPLIWRFNRRGVARGAALGLFSGFAIPVAQTPFAALFAVAARANLPVAALATFVTNPLTVPFIYFLAYKVGKMLLRVKSESLFAITPDAGMLERTLNWAVTLAGPTYVGLLLFAVLGATLGYFAVHLGWRLTVGLRWQRRGRLRSAAAPKRATECDA
jgi:uncharacterized protein (DUF2062 family)